MNKLSINVYADGVYNINGIFYNINSIKHYGHYKLRIINFKPFGITLVIN